MRYLFVARGLNEGDNNTPSDEVWAKVVDIDPSEVEKYEKASIDDFADDYDYGVEIMFEPLENFEDEWLKISEIW